MTFVPRCLRVALGLGALLSATTLVAQVTATAPSASGTESTQRFDIYGGAAYAHMNPGYAHRVAATNLLGWQGSITGWFSRMIGVEATARGVYGNFQIPSNAYNLTGTSNLSEYLFLFGPTARLYQSPKYDAGMHLLFGGAYGSFDQGYAGSGIQPIATGVYNNDLAFAATIGGWADYKPSAFPKFALRFVADYQPTRFGSTTQNEFAGSVGIVYKLGARNR